LVNIAGQEWTGNGLELSLEAHSEEHVKNTRQLLNLSAGRPQTMALPHYNPADHPWPKHVYHPDGRDMQVADETAMNTAVQSGFRDKPYPKAPGGADAVKADAAKKLAAAEANSAIQASLILQMQKDQEEMRALLASMKASADNEKPSARK